MLHAFTTGYGAYLGTSHLRPTPPAHENKSFQVGKTHTEDSEKEEFNACPFTSVCSQQHAILTVPLDVCPRDEARAETATTDQQSDSYLRACVRVFGL